MEHGKLIASAVGVGVGVGLGLVSARLAAPAPGGGGGGAEAAEVEAELRRLAIHGREGRVSFDNFPYYLSERMRLALTSAAYSFLGHKELPKHIRVLCNSSRTILLCGSSELYLQSLTKALAHRYNARLLALDLVEFSHRIHQKYGNPSSSLVDKRSLTKTALDKVSGLIGSLNFSRKKDEPRGSLEREHGLLDVKTSNLCTSTPSLRLQISLLHGAKDYDSDSYDDLDLFEPNWSLDEKVIIQSLYKILSSVSESNSIILYIRDVNRLLSSSERACSLFQKMLNKLSGRVLIIGSHLLDSDEDILALDEGVSVLFPYILETKPPREEAHLEKWKSQMEEDKKKIQSKEIRNHIADVLSANSLECDDLNSINADDDFIAIANCIEEIMAPAVSYHLMNGKDPEYRNGKLIISSESLCQGFSIFQESNLWIDTSLEPKVEQKKEIPDDEFEKRIRSSVIPPNEIGVTFDDIGALADIKESLQELVMLPLQRPDLFNDGLLKQCRGILLFGPPGTGKTMLAKAIANEAGASFLNISMSSITSKWYGECEKSIRALFSLAAKIAPTIIFVDEVDSMLGRRDNSSENEASRKIKNEFMTHWDGLLSKSNEKILVLAATNRPFDLDEAIVRRFEHRIMVGLPTSDSRELIFKTLLSKVTVNNIDFKELARMTDGYSGSDLKNLCVTAAYRPVKELILKEQQKKKDKKENAAASKDAPAENPKTHVNGTGNSESKKGENHKPETKKVEADKSDAIPSSSQAGRTTALRPITMDDLRQAKEQVAASFGSEGTVMNQIKNWNDLYGKGGSRKKQHLTYFS